MLPHASMALVLRSSSASRILAGVLAAAAVAVPRPVVTGRTEPAFFECRWTDRPVRIDGKGDDASWKAARVIERFALPWAGKGARAATRARLLWDRENLYFLAEMSDVDLYAEIQERDDAAWNGDIFMLMFKPSEDEPGYYAFRVNAAGKTMKSFLPQRRDGGVELYQPDGEVHMEVATSLRGTLNSRQDLDRGWVVEGRIPWRDFLRSGGRPEIDGRWKFALCRYDYRHDAAEPELSTSAPLVQPRLNRYEEYAALRFAGPDERASGPFGIERLIPLTTSRVSGTPDPPLPYTVRRVYPKLRLTNPVTVVREPDGDRLLVVVQESSGGASRVLRFRDEPDVDSAETLLSVDRAAYDIAFHPNFDKNGYLYVSSKGPLSAKKAGRKMQVSQFTMSRRAPFALDPASEKVIIDWPSDGHDGGAMVFGKDGMLYITSGDGTSDSDTDLAGQDMTRLLAKLLRIDVDNPDPERAYSVPSDNPFVGMKEVRPETWAFGFRNPWRMTVDRETGHIWVGNGGQDLWETAHLVERGANYGWSVYEGSHPFYLTRKLGPAPLTQPTLEHSHSESRSLTGGVVYHGQRFPELRGAYVYGDYSTGKIWAARHDGTRLLWHKEIADTTLQITGFGHDSEGEILVVDMRDREEGGFYSLQATPAELLTTPNSFPTRLSQTGLFRSVKGHVPQPGLIPYTVNAPLWSDGAYKERYIALPGAVSPIELTASGGWNFPDRALLVKSFALETEEGKPGSRRWIETRLLIKQDGEWVGYSYLWNDAQTEATLVEARGADRDFEIRVPPTPKHPAAIRKQTWHYPSRAECMTCHSRAANFVLGLTTLQMNREHDYGKFRDNQLRVLEHLGVLRVNWVKNMRDTLRAEGRSRGMTETQADAYVREQTENLSGRPEHLSSLLDFAPEKYSRLADPYDRNQDLDRRARSYLHSNCAQCHVGAGGGNSQIDLEFTTSSEKMRVFDVQPLHDTFGLSDARLIAPGSPERSVLLDRISHRSRGQMPPLATSVVDRDAVELIRDWIRRIDGGRSRESGSR
jgi:glucose/arabinose dehydrogenase